MRLINIMQENIEQAWNEKKEDAVMLKRKSPHYAQPFT